MTNTTTKLLLLGSLTGACTSSDPQQDHLPSASLTPHTSSRDAASACGDDIALYGAQTPDLRYTYTFDGNGYVTHADGVYTAGGANDSIDYTWDASQRFTHMLETRGLGDTRVEIGETYDGDNLSTYSYAASSTSYSENWLYTYANFLGAWQPQREIVTSDGVDYGYTLAYDALGRLISATPDTGDVTTYTYDDTALTITADTGNGKWTDTTTYGSDWRELSDVWGGSDPSVIDGSWTLTWDGDALVSETYLSGSEAAPHDLQTVEVDTIRYDCATARKTNAHGLRLAPRTRR